MVTLVQVVPLLLTVIHNSFFRTAPYCTVTPKVHFLSLNGSNKLGQDFQMKNKGINQLLSFGFIIFFFCENLRYKLPFKMIRQTERLGSYIPHTFLAKTQIIHFV